MGLAPNPSGLVAWDVFDAVLMPGEIILLMSWRDHSTAEAFEGKVALQDGARLRRVRVVRDYGMFDRREAPQYYPTLRAPLRSVRGARQPNRLAAGPPPIALIDKKAKIN